MRVLSLAFLLVLSADAPAQTAPRQLFLVQDLRLGANELGIMRDGLVAGGPNGRLVTTERFGFAGAIKAYDSSGKTLGWKVAAGRQNDADVMFPTRMGWIGGTNAMWIGDIGYHQVVLIDRQGKVTKSIEYPGWIHPRWAERRKYPLFASMEPWAVYPDSSMLVLPSRERSLIDTPGYDKSTIHLLRVSWSGAIQRTVAVLPAEQGRIVARGKSGVQHTTPIPFAARTFWGVSSDGGRIVIVEPGVTQADSGTYRVTTLSDRGDTVYSRRYPQPAARINQASIDNFLAGIQPFGGSSAEEQRAAAAKQIPLFKSFVTGAIVGYDHSVWVMMRALSDTSTERSAVILDERGDVVGRVTLPKDQAPMLADRNHYWAIEHGKSRAPTALLRYRVDATDAPPARSGRASGSSRPSRPPA